MQKGKLVRDIAASDAVAALSVEESRAQSFIFIHIEETKKKATSFEICPVVSLIVDSSFGHVNGGSWLHKLSLCSIILYLCHCTLWSYTTSAFNAVFWQLVLSFLKFLRQLHFGFVPCKLQRRFSRSCRHLLEHTILHKNVFWLYWLITGYQRC